MAYKQINKSILAVSKIYSKVEEIYNKVAEILSTEIIDPETIKAFVVLKTCVDSELSIANEALGTARIKKMFNIGFSRVQNQTKSTLEILSRVENDSSEEAKHYSERLRSYLESQSSVLFYLELVNQILNLPNSKKNLKKYLSRRQIISPCDLLLQRLESKYLELQKYYIKAFDGEEENA